MSEQLMAEVDRQQLAAESAAMQVRLSLQVLYFALHMFFMHGLNVANTNASISFYQVTFHDVVIQQSFISILFAQVWKGAEDGRLLRVLVRLTSVLDRPESDVDPQWAETGASSGAHGPTDSNVYVHLHGDEE